MRARPRFGSRGGAVLAFLTLWAGATPVALAAPVVVLGPRFTPDLGPAGLALEKAANAFRADLIGRIARVPGVEVILPGLDAALKAGRPLPRWRPDPVPGAAERLASAIAAYEDLRLADAVAALQALRSSLEPHAASLTDPELYAKVLLWTAVAEHADGRPEAGASFERYAVVRPDAKLSHEEYPPPVLGAYERARKRVKGALATLHVTTDPPGAEVSIDGVVRGVAPLSVPEVPVGKHVIRLSAPWRLPHTAAVDVGAGAASKVDVVLAVDEAATALKSFDDSLRAGATLADAAARLAGIAEGLGAARVLVPLVTRWKGGYVLMALVVPAGAPANATLAATVVDEGLKELSTAGALLQVAFESATPGVIVRATGGAAPAPPAIDPARPLLDAAVAPGAGSAAVVVAPGVPGGAGAGATGPGASGEKKRSRAWAVWVGVGGGFVAVAVGVVVGLAVAIQPAVHVTANFPEER